MKIRILLVDADPYAREGLRSCLSRHSQCEVVGEAANGDAIDKVRELAPDVVVVSMSRPGMDGLETTRHLRTFCPQTRVLVLAGTNDRDLVKEVVRSGAPGYLSKMALPSELVAAIERVHLGGTYFTPDVAQAFFEEYVQNGGQVMDRDPRLSARERQVLQLVVEGLPNKEMAEKLCLSVRTVEKHRHRVMRKIGARRATELVKLAVMRGWVDLNGMQ